MVRGKFSVGGKNPPVDRGLSAIDTRLGSFYQPWRAGDGWQGTPIWGDRMPTAAQAKNGGVVCSTVANIYLHAHGVLPPAFGGFRGGTEAWGVWARSIGEAYTPNKTLRPGDIVGSPYKGAALSVQGHIVVVLSEGRAARSLCYQADAFNGGGKPGLNKMRTVAGTDKLLSDASKFTYIIRGRKLLS